MKKAVKTILLLAVLIAFSTTLSASANRAPFQAVPILPENQISDRAFYDIQIAHGKTQDLYLVLKNDTLDDIDIIITAVTATTDASGKVLYSQKGYPDRSLKFPFESLVTPNPSTVKVPALTEIETSVRLNSPGSRYEGIILGALHVTTKPSESDTPGIINSFAYSLAVRLTSELAQNIAPDIVFEGAEFFAGQRSTGFILDIRNIVPELFRYTELTVDLYSENETVFSNTMLIDFAPNSFYPLTLIANRSVPPGTYTADITLTVREDTFYFSKQFIVYDNDNDADIFLELLLPQREQAPGVHPAVFPLWMWLFPFILIAAMIILIIFMYKKKRQEKKTVKK